MHIGLITRSQVDYALDLANEFISQGFSVTLYLDETQAIEEVGDHERPVECFYESGQVPRVCSLRLLQTPRMRDPRSFLFIYDLTRTLVDDGIDIAHILLNPGEIWFAVLACLVNKMPVVTTMIVPVANIGERLPTSIIWITNKLAVIGSDAVIVNGADQKEIVQRVYGISTDRLFYIPLSLHARAVKLRNNTVEEEPNTILFFGRAHPQKGLEYLIEAQPIITKELPDVKILISAHGEYLKHCCELISDRSKYEINEGVVSGNLMSAYFQRAALVALPYLSASTSGVLVTAYSFGKPVVASRVGCLAEYVEDGVTGRLVSPMDVGELANVIIQIMSNNELRRQMGKNAENWIIEKQKSIIEQTLNVYRGAIRIHSNSVRA